MEDRRIEELQARPYQNELLEKAKKENIIVYLGTGSGKTYIANMLIKDFRGQLTQGKKAIFLVSSLPLVDQQADAIRRTTGLSVGSFCGADGLDDWSEEKWRQEIAAHQVLVLIHQVFLDTLTHAFFKISDAALLIMDECHHAQSGKDHPYTRIMKDYYLPLKNNPESRSLPRILGLTACLMVKKVTKDRFHVEKKILEDLMDSKVETTTDMYDILKYVTAPRESICRFPAGNQNCSQLYKMIESHCQVALVKLTEVYNNELARLKSTNEENINFCETAIKELMKDFKTMKNEIINNIAEGIKDLGLIALVLTYDGFKARAEKSDSKAFRVYYSVEARREMVQAVLECLQLIGTVLIQTPYDQHSYQSLKNLSSTKVLKLIEQIRGDEDEETKRTIVFVQKQFHTETLSKIIKNFSRVDPLLSGVITDFAFSPGSNLNVKDPKEREQINNNRRKLRETLAKFKDGRVNTLISTSVIEEGLDVRTCNLVIKFDFPDTFRSYVQSKGRARARPSEYLLMVPEEEEKLKYAKRYQDYRDMEELSLKECHHHGTDEDEEPEDEDFDDLPYMARPTDPDSARIDGSQAVRLIHKYIQKVPVDRFTRLTPVWKCEYKVGSENNQDRLFAGLGCSTKSGWTWTCYMPHKTPFTAAIRGEVRPRKKAAKSCTAKLIVEILHKKGELDHSLKVKKRKFIPEEEDDEEVDEDGAYNPNGRKSGTKKKKRFYENQYPEELHGKEKYYLHVINIQLVKENNSFKYNFYYPQHDKDGGKFGFISSKSSPPCGPFLLFPPSGEHQIFIETGTEIRMDRSTRAQVESFQRYIWDEVLKVSEDDMEQERNQTRVLIVPVRGQNVDCDLLRSFSSPKKIKLSVDSVVYPSYKEKKENYFIEEFVPTEVLSVEHKMSGENITFRQYFSQVHNITLRDLTLIRPASADKKSYMLVSNTEPGKKRAKKNVYDTTLFPAELMEVEVISAGLWRQAQLLPSIIHRFESLTASATFLWSLGYQTPGQWTLEIPGREPSSASVFQDLLQFDQGNAQSPSPGNILTAVTLKAANDIFDMERLEIVGDSFLKYYTGLFLYYKLLELERGDIVNSEEGDLSKKRSKIVGNKNLLKVGQDLQLDRIVISGQLETDRTWQPPGQTRKDLEQKLIEADKQFEEKVRVSGGKDGGQAVSVGSLLSWICQEDLQQLELPGDREELLRRGVENFQANKPAGVKLRSHKLISDKSIADCIEALIGCFLLKSGQAGALEFMAKIGINLSSDNSVDDVLARLKVRDGEFKTFRPQSHAFIDEQAKVNYKDQASSLYARLGVEEIERIIGYKFTEPSFLLQAFTHASYGDNRLTGSYERLEYIGDAVLDYLVTGYVYDQAGQNVGPGRITDTRSALVNNNMFASVLVDNNLHTFILMQSPTLQHKVDAYAEDRRDRSTVLSDLKLINEEEPPELELVEVPKVLGDVLESLMGAIFIDSGHDLKRVWEIYSKLCLRIDEVIRNPPMNSKKELMEKYPDKVKFSGKRDDAREKMVVTAKIDVGGGRTKEFRGLGENKAMATLAACKLALRRF